MIEPLIYDASEESSEMDGVEYLEVSICSDSELEDYDEKPETNDVLKTENYVEVIQDTFDDDEQLTEVLSTPLTLKMEDNNTDWPTPSHWNNIDAPVECDICGLSAPGKYSLLEHLGNAHNFQRPFSCESCPKIFQNK